MSGLTGRVFVPNNLFGTDSGRPAAVRDSLEGFVVVNVRSAQQSGDGIAEEAKRVVRDHFNSLTNFQFGEVIGTGAFGVVYSVREKRVGRSSRKLVVKRALTEKAEKELEQEIRVMSRLGGSAHIARVVTTTYDGFARRRAGVFSRMASRVVQRRKHILTGLPGPTLVLEHLENGSILNLINAMNEKNMRRLPNRVLWSFYLCLVRACVAMKYPPNQPPGSPARLEEIPTDGSAPANIMHCDMHSGNVLLGTPGDFPEHAVVPPMKLIDFGLSLVRARSNERNLFDISKQMYYMIICDFPNIAFNQLRVHHGITTLATDILPRNDGREPFPLLDPDLRDLIAWCLAQDENQRPSLAVVLEVCKNAVATRTAGYYGVNAARETDYVIRLLLQELVHNA